MVVIATLVSETTYGHFDHITFMSDLVFLYDLMQYCDHNSGLFSPTALQFVKQKLPDLLRSYIDTGEG